MGLDAHDELLAGRYRKLGALGVGGMARVYLAEDKLLGRRVAVKVLHADSPDDAAIRFEREAKLGASLNHPNLVSIFDIAADGESVLIVMEHVDGETLKDAIERGPLAAGHAAEVIRDVAAALDHAHAHGVVHRDVKPGNILLRRDGMTKLADLGIATAAERTAITRSDVVLGTASYMAPEQLSGGTAGPRADVYALAVVAFEALSGRKARSGRTPVEVAHDVVSGAPPDLRQAWPGAPPAAAAALARGMEREPEARPASAGALASDLERALTLRPQVPAATAATARLPSDASAPGDRSLPVAPPPRSPAKVGRSSPARAGPPRSSAKAGRSSPAPAGPPRSPAKATRSSRASRWWPAAAALAVAVLATIAGVAALGGGADGDGAGDGGGKAGSGQRVAAEKDDGRRSEPAQDRGDAAVGSSPAPPPETPPAEPAPSPTAGADDPVALNDQGYELMQARRYDEAVPLLQRAVDAYPDGSQDLTYAYALYNLGRSLRLAGRAAEAVPILERRLEIPNQTDTVQRELDAARAAAG